jgi:hypothetical protein
MKLLPLKSSFSLVMCLLTTSHCGGVATDSGDAPSHGDPPDDGGVTADVIPACPGAPTKPTLLATASFVSGLATDGESVYWSDNQGNLSAVPASGGAVKVLATDMAAYNDFPQLALDATYVYFAGGPDVDRLPKTGGGFTTLATGQQVGGLAVGEGQVYWTSSFQPKATGASSGSLDRVAESGEITAIANDLGFPGELAVDDTNAYWVDSLGAIDMVPLTGGRVTVLVKNQAGINGIAAAGGYVYWTNFSGQIGTCGLCPPMPAPKLGDGTLLRTAVKGGASTVIAKGYGANGVALDDRNAYWSDGTVISAVPLDGGDAIVLAEGGAFVGPVIDACSVYWGESDGSIRRVGKPR